MTGPMDASHVAHDGVSMLHAARAADPDRFFCALFLPAAARAAAMVLIAFNHECVRAVATPASWSVAGPMAGLIRLQWWRDVVESGNAQRHDTACALLGLLAEGRVRRDTIEAIITARENELDGLPDRENWRAAMLAGAGGVQVAMAMAAGVAAGPVLERVRLYGGVYGVGALVRYLPAVLAAGRCPLPDDMLADAGLTRDGLRTGHASPGQIEALRMELRQQGQDWLAQARMGGRLPRPALAASLSAVMGLRDMKARALPASPPRGVGDRLVVMAARMRGRI